MYLLDRMGRSARRPTDLVVVHRGRMPWREVHENATRAAGGLQQKGIGPGDTVAILAETSIETVIAVRAVLLSGAAVHMVRHPARSYPPRLDRVDATALIVGPPFDGIPGIRLADLSGNYRRPDLSEDDVAVVQCTSGSTGPPQVARVTHASLGANIDAIQVAADRYFGADVLCSWLPLHHDMGLIGFLVLPMVTGAGLVLQRTAEFVRRPRSWMETISAYGASATGAPNFAYAMVAPALERGPRLALGQLAFALCGGERIRPDDITAFTRAAGRHGMSPTAFLAAYGMAESTLASTFSPPRRGLITDRGLTVVGHPVPGLVVRIGEAGEIQLRGSSIARVDPSRMTDGWLRTGDLGHLGPAGLVVKGRIDDLIIVAGRNIYPEDVEDAVGTVVGIRPGNVVAVPDPRHGTDGILVIAESRCEVDTAAVVDRVHDAVGIRPSGLRLLGPGQLPKTSSGKLRRREAARRFALREA